jgi:hypothetical protein
MVMMMTIGREAGRRRVFLAPAPLRRRPPLPSPSSLRHRRAKGRVTALLSPRRVCLLGSLASCRAARIVTLGPPENSPRVNQGRNGGNRTLGDLRRTWPQSSLRHVLNAGLECSRASFGNGVVLVPASAAHANRAHNFSIPLQRDTASKDHNLAAI